MWRELITGTEKKIDEVNTGIQNVLNAETIATEPIVPEQHNLTKWPDSSHNNRGNILLSANNVGLEFADSESESKRKVILKDVNFVIRDVIRPGMTQGQVISLIGRSGCGKTQLLRILSGLNPPNKFVNGKQEQRLGLPTGQVLLNADQQPVIPGNMGIVPQDYFLFPWRRVRKILEMAASKNPEFKDAKLRAEAVEYYIVAFELTEHLTKFPAQLSGGQKQRVSISQQLLNGSNFLLMDEPFSGLDSLMIDKTTALISKVAESDELKTIIIVSHDLANSVAISDTVYILSKQGRAETEGATIIKEIDLIERGLAWNKDVKEMSVFHETLKEIKQLL